MYSFGSFKIILLPCIFYLRGVLRDWKEDLLGCCLSRRPHGGVFLDDIIGGLIPSGL